MTKLDEPFRYRCKLCDRQWSSRLIEPRCPACGNRKDMWLEVLDQPEQSHPTGAPRMNEDTRAHKFALDLGDQLEASIKKDGPVKRADYLNGMVEFILCSQEVLPGVAVQLGEALLGIAQAAAQERQS